MLKQRLKASETPPRLLEIEFGPYKSCFFVTPTWRINPNNTSDLMACDFALGCLDYIAGLDEQYSSLEQYREAFKAVDRLICLTECSDYSLN